MPLETLAAWTLGDLGNEDGGRVEEHLFDCDRCAARAEKLDALVRQLRGIVPPWLTRERRQRLESAMPTLPVSAVFPGKEASIELGSKNPIGFWVIKAQLEGVDRLDCEFVSQGGAVLTSFEDVPFDADRGEVVLACQVHYRNLGFPADMVVRLEAVEQSGRRQLAEYLLHHLFV